MSETITAYSLPTFHDYKDAMQRATHFIQLKTESRGDFLNRIQATQSIERLTDKEEAIYEEKYGN